MATTDDLTKLFNRKVALERLEEEVSKHIRLEIPLSCLMLDIDHFKAINDKYGHQAGDAVLKSTSGILQKNSRKYDIVCRYGGEEFMIVLPSTDIESAMIVAEKIREKVNKDKVVYNNRIIKTTISVGAAQLHIEGGENTDRLIKRADDALYKAKNNGRNKVIG
jgi:diguanylate cyclase (GGDEF)-like protein